jgi:ribosomal protein L7Ae-like RNA K-turn-binding protein
MHFRKNCCNGLSSGLVMNIPERIKAFLGFAKKSGQLFTGEKAVENSIKINKAKLVLIATDFPEKRRRFCIRFCEEQKIPYGILGTKEEYGQILQTSPRGLLAITDIRMAEEIRKNLS